MGLQGKFVLVVKVTHSKKSVCPGFKGKAIVVEGVHGKQGIFKKGFIF